MGVLSVISQLPYKNNNLSLFDVLTSFEKLAILTLQVLALKSVRAKYKQEKPCN